MSLSRTETGAELWQSGRGREVVPQGSIFATDGMCLSRINDDGSRTQRLHATWQMLWIEGGVRVSAICSTVFPLLISITPVLPRLSMSQLLSMQVPISQRHCASLCWHPWKGDVQKTMFCTSSLTPSLKCSQLQEG
ncbi:unnamed protein product [Lepidochelys olivacea]